MAARFGYKGTHVRILCYIEVMEGGKKAKDTDETGAADEREGAAGVGA